MELFSKRNTSNVFRRFRYTPSNLRDDNKYSLLADTARNRLQEQVRYCIRSNKFLEPFLVVKNEIDNTHHLHEQTLSELSLRELGYDLVGLIHPERLVFSKEEENGFNDYHFFDLIELLLVFSKNEERPKLASRISKIFSEEDDNFTIHQFMIFKKGDTDLRALIPLIKNKVLATKIKDYYETSPISGNQEIRARNSADIIQNIFSAPTKQDDTKKYSEQICKEVASKCTTKINIKNLADLLSETVQNSKKLSNQIVNIRHTDQSAIPVKSPDFYSLIASKNIRIAELVIFSLPEKFISTEDPESMKENYLSQFSIPRETLWVLKKPEVAIPIIREEDLPF